jgi:hypothetical protein
MKEGGIGGANTRTGIEFEIRTDLATVLSKLPGYQIEWVKEKSVKRNSEKYMLVHYDGVEVGTIFQKYKLYHYLEKHGINWKEVLSAQLLPDDGIFVIVDNTAYIIEKKSQQGSGSVDEKLQTCDFKKKQYMKLFSRINIEVKYMYLLDNWFRADKYKDVLDYIHSVGCEYYFESQ